MHFVVMLAEQVGSDVQDCVSSSLTQKWKDDAGPLPVTLFEYTIVT